MLVRGQRLRRHTDAKTTPLTHSTFLFRFRGHRDERPTGQQHQPRVWGGSQLWAPAERGAITLGTCLGTDVLRGAWAFTVRSPEGWGEAQEEGAEKLRGSSGQAQAGTSSYDGGGGGPGLAPGSLGRSP